MICRLCLNNLDEQNAILLFGAVDNEKNNTMPENYLVQLISTHLYLCLSRDDAISTSICTTCCAQLESFHKFWKLVELKQTTLCSQFLEIDCDVNWSEEGDAELIAIDDEAEPESDKTPPTAYDDFAKEEYEITEPMLKADAKAVAHKFPCMFCEKSFKMRRYLEEHVATHTGDRPIACPYCEMAFRCRSNMYTHVKTKHTAQWLKARADRESAKFNTNNNIQTTANGDKNYAYIETDALKPKTVQAATKSPLAAGPTTPSQLPINFNAPISVETNPVPGLPMQQSPEKLMPIKSEPVEMEAINLCIPKVTTSNKRVTRASRRKTHSPKKVQHAEYSASEDSNTEEGSPELRQKLIKLELQTCKENELMLANYNAAAVAAAVAASLSSNTDSLQQRICASIMQQPDLLTALAVASTTTAATAIPAEISSQSNTPALETEAAGSSAYTCQICGQNLCSQRALNNHLHSKHNSMQPTPNLEMVACANCGELPGQKHRCMSKAKYACEICGKSFKMKRYLEEHFATHTGVKLHTCAFCPTEFRSKSNMYHHTKRKHKVEWERSRATRNAAKSATQEQQMDEPISSAAQADSNATSL